MAGMNLINLYQNEYSFEEKVNENFKKVDTFLTLSVVKKITSHKEETEHDKLYLIDQNDDDFFSDKVGQVACYNANLGWFFYQPKDGSIMFLQSDGKFYFYSNGNWMEMQNSTIQTIDGATMDLSNYITKTANLSDLQNKQVARENLDVYAKDEVYSKSELDDKILTIQTNGDIDISLFAKTSNNLSDLTNKDSARENLSVYAKSDTYKKSEVYSKDEVDSKLANISTVSSGGAVDASNFLRKDYNLADLQNTEIARANLNVYAKGDTYNRAKNLLDVLDQDEACHNIGTLRDWEIRRVGDYKMSAVKTDHDNWFICDGREMSRAEYPELFALIGTDCGEGDGETTFNLPDFRNKTMWGANGNLNSTMQAGLPNITGNFQPGGLSGLTYSAGILDVDGCFSKSKLERTNYLYCPSSSVTTAYKRAEFDASISNSIYGNSATVQPPAICVNVFILVK